MQTILGVVGWALAHPDEAATVMAIIASAIAAIRRWALAKRMDRLAAYADAAGRAAGRVNLAISQLPASTNAAQALRDLIAKEAAAQLAEFSTSAKKIGATAEKTQDMIAGELGKIAPQASAIVAGVIAR